MRAYLSSMLKSTVQRTELDLESILIKQRIPQARGLMMKVEIGGKDYVLKVLQSLSREVKEETLFAIGNVSRNFDLLQHPTMTAPRAVSNSVWYIMDHFDGKDVYQLGFLALPEKRIIDTYLSMMRALHAAGLVIQDHNWGKVLVGRDEEVRICDPDYCCRPQDIPSDVHYVTAPFTALESIMNREHSPTTDLKSFFLMLDAMYNNDVWVPDGSDSSILQFKADNPKYPESRAETFPPNLRVLARELLSFEKGLDITVEDVQKAADADYVTI